MHGRALPEQRARDNAHALALGLDHGQRAGAVMEEFRRDLLGRFGQSDPALDAGHFPARRRFPFRRGALRMHNALARGHPVHIAGRDDLRGAKTVAMHDFPIEQVGHRRKPDMGMRPHVDPLAQREFGRAHLVPENEGADHLALGGGQRAPHIEAAQIAHARHDDDVERAAGPAVAGNRVFCGPPAHAFVSLCEACPPENLTHRRTCGIHEGV